MRDLRAAAALTFSGVALALVPAAAPAALLPTTLPLTTTVTGVLAPVTGTIAPVTDTVGGVASGVPVVGGTLEGVLGSVPGSGGSTLPTGALTGLIDSLLGGSGAAAGGGTTSAGGGITTTGAGAPSGSAGVVGSSDRAAPLVGYRLLSRLKRAATTGRLKLRITSSEASVVAFDALMRAGTPRRLHGHAVSVARKLFHMKSMVLAFNRAGSLTATLKLSDKARAMLRTARTARLSLRSWASDVGRNQTRANVKRTLRG